MLGEKEKCLESEGHWTHYTIELRKGVLNGWKLKSFYPNHRFACKFCFFKTKFLIACFLRCSTNSSTESVTK
jgi:hypothetical protein